MEIASFPEVENIHAIALPLLGYSNLITANIYVLGKGPITLIDAGPKFPGAFDFVKEHLHKIGFDFADIDRIIITHGHIDHFGLAKNIQEAAGKQIEFVIHSEDKWRISTQTLNENIWGKESQELMAMVDMPAYEVEKMKNRFSFFKVLCDPLDEVSTIEDNHEFQGNGFHLKVIHTPGHSPGSISLYEPEKKILFSGDHIIKHITPNPLWETRKDKLKDPNYQSLIAYMDSLNKLKQLDVRYVFPGHGEYIEDLPGIIASYTLHHRERMDLVWLALKKEVRPLFHIIDEVFAYVPDGDAFLAISEIMVHLEMLINEKRAELINPGPPALYRAL
jgi:glyoxylase-like metal-dependent hydrolase (beta-lactamase superfamily II)